MQFRRIICAALLVAAGSPLASAAEGGAPAGSPPSPNPQPGTPRSLSQPPTKTSSATTVPSKTTTGKNNNANIIGSLWRVSREFGVLGCVPQILPLVTSLPQNIPPEVLGADMIKQALAQTTLALDQVCEYHVTGTAGTAFSSFLPRWYNWYDEHADHVRRLVEKCPKVGALTQTAEAYRACTHVVEIISTAAAAAAEEASATVAADAKTKVTEQRFDEKVEL